MRWVIGLCFVLVASAGCKSNTVDQSNNSNNTNSYVSAVVGPPGGHIDGPDGATVDIPMGALTTDVKVRVGSVVGPTLKPGWSLASKVFAFEPHGTTFASAVQIGFPFNGDPASLAVIRANDERGPWETISAAQLVGGRAQIPTTTFSLYAVVAGADKCAAGPAASAPTGSFSDGAGVFPAQGSLYPEVNVGKLVDGFASRSATGSIVLFFTDYLKACGLSNDRHFKVNGTALALGLENGPFTARAYPSEDFRFSAGFTATSSTAPGGCSPNDQTGFPNNTPEPAGNLTINSMDASRVTGTFDFIGKQNGSMVAVQVRGTFDLPFCKPFREIGVPGAYCCSR